jgi:hypothetical protein
LGAEAESCGAASAEKDVEIVEDELNMAKKKFDPKSVPIYALEDPEGYGLTEEQTLAVWQHGVDTGQVWSLQGWYGRNASALLEQGLLHYPKKRTHDYYGNPIPTQSEMKKRRKMKEMV